MSTLSLPNSRRAVIPVRRHRRQGFSLVEILVAVSLLAFIVVGLLMMFNQTQRAFRLSMTQVDVLESGRMVTDMLSREIEQASASQAEPLRDNNGKVVYQTTNFFAELAYNFPAPLLQGLPGSARNGNASIQDCRTNIVQNFFFMSRHNQDWIGIGYALIQHDGPHVGSLYRFTATNHPPFRIDNLNGYFRNELGKAINAAQNDWPITNFTQSMSISRVADGIVHLRVRPYAPNGMPLMPYAGASNLVFRLPNGNFRQVEETYGGWQSANGAQLDELDSYFVQDALPAQVELELGVLEPAILERYRGMAGNEPAQRNYLSNHVGNVQLFRQRIPIRNVDSSVYQ